MYRLLGALEGHTLMFSDVGEVFRVKVKILAGAVFWEFVVAAGSLSDDLSLRWPRSYGETR